MKILELKNTIAEIKQVAGQDSRVERTEVRITELEDRSIEFTQYEQRKKID